MQKHTKFNISIFYLCFIVIIITVITGCGPPRGVLDARLGFVTKDFFNGNVSTVLCQSGHDELQIATKDSQGRLLMIGTSSHNRCHGKIVIARYNKDGTPDNNFNSINPNTNHLQLGAGNLGALEATDANVVGDSIIILGRRIGFWCCDCDNRCGNFTNCSGWTNEPIAENNCSEPTDYADCLSSVHETYFLTMVNGSGQPISSFGRVQISSGILSKPSVVTFLSDGKIMVGGFKRNNLNQPKMVFGEVSSKWAN